VRIQPDGNTVIIGGRNEQGKTSLLDAIVIALGNKKLIDKSLQPKDPVNRDANNSGKITVDLGELTVTRTVTKKGGGQLIVANKDGARFQSPQGILDQFYSNFTFDPLSFSRMDKTKRVETLKQLIGLDFTSKDTARKEAYDERTSINRDIKKVEAELSNLPYYPDAPETKMPVDALASQLDEIHQHNRENDRKRTRLKAATDQVSKQQNDVDQKNRRVEELKKQLAEAEYQRDSAMETLQTLEHDRDKLAAEVDQLQDREPSEIMAKMTEIDEVNAKIDANEAWKAKQQSLENLRKEAQQLTDRIADIDREKSAAIAAADMPIAGLSFSEDDVVFEETPFGDLSSSAKLKVSVAMGFKMNPRLKVLLVRDGSLLDEQSLKLISEMAEAEDGQVWIERVGHGSECHVIIEDGELLQKNTAPATKQKPEYHTEKF
jgi:DNA repair exonuclease SbcCD ATPase subunit